MELVDVDFRVAVAIKCSSEELADHIDLEQPLSRKKVESRILSARVHQVHEKGSRRKQIVI